MNRRGFLQGLASLTAGGVIVKATDAEIAAFGVKTEESVVLQTGAISIPTPKMGADWKEAIPGGARRGGKWLLYNYRGKAIGALKDIEFSPNGVGSFVVIDTREAASWVTGIPSDD